MVPVLVTSMPLPMLPIAGGRLIVLPLSLRIAAVRRPARQRQALARGHDEACVRARDRRLDGGDGAFRPGLQGAQTWASVCGSAKFLRIPARRFRPQGSAQLSRPQGYLPSVAFQRLASAPRALLKSRLRLKTLPRPPRLQPQQQEAPQLQPQQQEAPQLQPQSTGGIAASTEATRGSAAPPLCSSSEVSGASAASDWGASTACASVTI